MNLLKGRIGKIGSVALAISLITILGVGVFAPAPVEAARVRILFNPRVHVANITYGGWGPNDGVELKLTSEGIRFGASRDGAHQIARWVMNHPEWKGTRSHANVASEIKWHCWAYNIPRIQRRIGAHVLNPVNIEFFLNWPQIRIG